MSSIKRETVEAKAKELGFELVELEEVRGGGFKIRKAGLTHADAASLQEAMDWLKRHETPVVEVTQPEE